MGKEINWMSVSEISSSYQMVEVLGECGNIVAAFPKFDTEGVFEDWIFYYNEETEQVNTVDKVVSWRPTLYSPETGELRLLK